MQQPALSWSKVTFSAQLLNSPVASWAIGISAGSNKIVHTLDTGIGGAMRSGPYILSPGEILVAVITGGSANDSAVGSYYGEQGIDPNDVHSDPVSGNTISIGAGSVVISGTPNVNVSGGTISIGNVPAVTVSGIATVAISGTPTVSISGTPNVSIAGTPNVNVSGGSVTISSGAVQVSTAAGVQVVTTASHKYLGFAVTGAGGASADTNFTMPIGTQAIALLTVGYPASSFTHLKALQPTAGGIAYESYSVAPGPTGVGFYVMAIFPIGSDVDGGLRITVAGTSAIGVYVVALMSSSPEWMEYYQPPWQRPNQPATEAHGGLAIGGNGTLLSGTANVHNYLHQVKIIANVVAAPTAFPLIQLTAGGTPIAGFGMLQAAGSFAESLDFKGVDLGAGNDLKIVNNSGVAITFDATAIWSKA